MLEYFPTLCFLLTLVWPHHEEANATVTKVCDYSWGFKQRNKRENVSRNMPFTETVVSRDCTRTLARKKKIITYVQEC